VKATIEALAQEVLEDLKRLGAETSDEARQIALDTAILLEKVGASGASDEMVDAARETIELKWQTLRLKTTKAVIMQRVDAWVIASRILTKVILAL
jgi:hypothetical protein